MGDLPRRRVRAVTTNEHWFVGDSLVLRRYNALRPLRMIGYEHAVLAALHERGWPVPVAQVAHGDTVVVHDDRAYALFLRLPGRPGRAGSPGDARLLGLLLARLHASLGAVDVAPPAEVFPPALLIVVDPLWRRVDEALDRSLASRVHRGLDELHADVRSMEPVVRGAPRGVIHGEWHAGNMLFRGGEITGLLDFDFVHPDLLIVDVAIATLPLDVGAAAELVAGYARHRDLAAAELSLIGIARRAGLFQHLWGLFHLVLSGHSSALAHLATMLDRIEGERERWPAIEAAIEPR